MVICFAPMNWNIAFLVIGVLALLLAIPLTGVANLLMTRVEIWWSTTSESRLRKRIVKVEKKLQEVKREWKFTPAEWRIYSTAVLACGFLALFSYGAFAAFLLSLLRWQDLLVRFSVPHEKITVSQIVDILLSMLGVSAVLYTYCLISYLVTRKAHRQEEATALEKEREKLAGALIKKVKPPEPGRRPTSR